MNRKIINLIIFTVGAAFGSAVTWKIVKDRYEKIVQEEIKSVKEVFSDRFNSSNEETSSEESDEDMPEEDPVSDYRKICWDDLEDLDPSELEEEEYQADLAEYAVVSKYEDIANIYKEGGADNMPTSEPREPYVIEPIEFGELDGYKTFELTYYEDGILEDEDYDIVKNPEEILGPYALGSFGEYEDDSVFVRNERLRADFQILKDYRTYDEARSIGPGRVDDE